MFKALNNFFGAVVSLVLVALLAIGAWWGASAYLSAKRDREQIAALRADLEAKQKEIARLETAMRLLKVDHRVAQIEVLSQQGSEKEKNLHTTLRFVELDDKGNTLGPAKTYTIQGDTVYVDALWVSFSDEYVEAGDPLRGTSLCLFRRIFSEHQKPTEGYALDAVGSQPAAYGSGRPVSEFEREIWAKFWDYANDPAKAKQLGIKAIHGQAPYEKLMLGKRYKVLLRASGGLSFHPEDVPPARPAGPSS